MGFWVIGTYKLVKALLLLAAGVCFLYVAQAGVPSGLGHLALWLHVSPEERHIRMAVSRLDCIDQQHLEAIGVAIILYGLLYVAQSVGLLLRRRWGAYLVIVTTGFLIPVESYELIQRLTLTRFTILAVNVAIVLYLVAKLRQDGRQRAGGVGGPAPSTL